jgi:hypothetical protein
MALISGNGIDIKPIVSAAISKTARQGIHQLSGLCSYTVHILPEDEGDFFDGSSSATTNTYPRYPN